MAHGFHKREMQKIVLDIGSVNQQVDISKRNMTQAKPMFALKQYIQPPQQKSTRRRN